MTLKKLNKGVYIALAVTLICLSFYLSAPNALANTDGTELKIVDEPDKLVLDLGAAWAGTQFTLKTDYGLYPAPVTVNDAGILTMDLGGSKTYSLKLLVAPPVVDDTVSPEVIHEVVPAEPEPEPATEYRVEPDSEHTITTDQLKLLEYIIAGLVLLVLALITIVVLQRGSRRVVYYRDPEYEKDDAKHPSDRRL